MYSVNFGNLGASGALVKPGATAPVSTPGPALMIGTTANKLAQAATTVSPVASQFTAAGPTARVASQLRASAPSAVTAPLFVSPAGMTQAATVSVPAVMAQQPSARFIASVPAVTAQQPAAQFTAAGPAGVAQASSNAAPAAIQTLIQDLPRSDRPNEQPVPDAPVPDPTALVPAADAAEATKGLPIWAWALIGVGGLGAVGGIAYLAWRHTRKTAPATAGLSSVTVKTAREIPKAEYYVLSNDKFMSGWGPATGRTNTIILPADSWEEAQRIADYARGRSEQKNVRIVGRKPKLQRHVMYSLMSRADAPAWYGKW